MRKFRFLRADEIELRVGTVGKNGCSLLLYKDARCDQNLLDETVGETGWQRDHKEIKGNMYCGVAIFDEKYQQWVWKWDAGKESETEGQKGEASDSFKRACVNWGIGRELYSANLIWHLCDTEEYKDKNGKTKYKLKNMYETNGMKVSKILYKDDCISYLQIVDKKGLVVYENGMDAADEKLDTIDPAMAKTISDLAANKGVALSKICDAYKVKDVLELTHEQAGKVKAKLMKTEVKK